jgi:hypothetical protein
MHNELEEIALAICLANLHCVRTPSSTFKMVVEVEIRNILRPLLIYGTVYPLTKRAYVYAILNPDADVLIGTKVPAPGIFGRQDETMRNHCDEYVYLSIDATRTMKKMIDRLGCHYGHYVSYPARHAVLDLKMVAMEPSCNE